MRRGFPATGRGSARRTEEMEQRLFVRRLRLDPRTNALPWFAPPNGARMGEAQAYAMKANGMQRGVPDWLLCCPSADGQSIGLALEFKRPDGKGRVSAEQRIFARQLTAAGWRVEFPTSKEQAWDILAAYLALTP